jgi:hypothetical protein
MAQAEHFFNNNFFAIARKKSAIPHITSTA